MEMDKNAFFRLPAMYINGLEMCVDCLKSLEIGKIVLKTVCKLLNRIYSPSLSLQTGSQHER